jgi:hypothetical protein
MDNHEEHSNRVVERMMESREWNSKLKEIDKSDTLTIEDKDVFTAIIADEFREYNDKPGSLVFCMLRLMSQFDIKRK